MSGENGGFTNPDRRAVVVFVFWFCLEVMVIVCEPWPARGTALTIFTRPGLVIKNVLLIPAHPLLVPCMISAPINLALTPEIMSDRTYFLLAKLAAIRGWVLILGTLALSGRRRFRTVFYVVLGIYSLLLLFTYCTAFAITT